MLRTFTENRKESQDLGNPSASAGISRNIDLGVMVVDGGLGSAEHNLPDEIVSQKIVREAQSIFVALSRLAICSLVSCQSRHFKLF